MSEGGKTQRPGATAQAPQTPAPQTELPSGFRAVDPAKSVGPARFDGIHEERRAATTQIQRSLKAWRAASGAAGKSSVPTTTGAPLPSAVRSKMEPKLGASLDGVRVHTGGESAEAAKGFGARAFTVGEDVHFNSGEFSPGTKEGDKLLAHELTHVVQGQKAGVQRKAEENGGEGKKSDEVSDPNEAAEQEADAVSDKVAGEIHDDKEGGDEAKDGKGGAKEGKEKPAPIAAKLEGVGLKVFRAADPAPAGQLMSPGGKPAKEGEVQMTAPPTLELHGYGGVRKVNGQSVKDIEKELKTIEDKEKAASAPGGKKPTPEELQKKTKYKATLADIDKAKKDDYLIFAGHIGVSMDGGATIYGFTPVRPDGMPKEEMIAALHSHTMTFAGQVRDDKPHFDLARRCASEKGWDTDVTTAARPLTTAAHAETKKKLQELAGMAPGAHGLYYSFPLSDAQPGKYFVDAPGPDGKIVKGECQANCATFPGKIGIELPEQSGNLRFFMPALRQQAAGGTPK